MNDNDSLIQAPRNYYDIMKLQDAGVLEDFLEQPFTFIAETITGALAVGKTGVLVAGGRVVQALMKGILFKQWKAEFQRLREAGKIPDDFAERRYGFQTWVELMTILDEESPDADRLRALKAMFFAVNKVSVTDAEQIYAYQLWQIAKRLGSGELHLLRVIYQNRNERWSGEGPLAGTGAFDQWVSFVAKASGHGSVGLVRLYEKKLEELSLLTGRLISQPNRVLTQHARLSDLGIGFYEHIQNYEIEINELTPPPNNETAMNED